MPAKYTLILNGNKYNLIKIPCREGMLTKCKQKNIRLSVSILFRTSYISTPVICVRSWTMSISRAIVNRKSFTPSTQYINKLRSALAPNWTQLISLSARRLDMYALRFYVFVWLRASRYWKICTNSQIFVKYYIYKCLVYGKKKY